MAMSRPIAASAGMYGIVTLATPHVFGEIGDVIHLVQLIGVGVCAYTACLFLISRESMREAVALVRGGAN